MNIERLERDKFLSKRNEFLTSARPIQSPEHLKGRDRALASLIDALQSPGRHAFIYGYRGVGKTSLALTAAFQLQSAVGAPVVIACDSSTTFSQLCSDILREALAIPTIEKKGQSRLNFGASLYGVGGNISIDRPTQSTELRINSVNDAISYFKQAASRFTVGIIVVVDEFDQFRGNEEHRKVATLVKQLSDQDIPVRFIFCGISESVEALFSEHESIFRQIHSHRVDQLSFQSCLDIINDASAALHMEIRNDFKYRIAKISDGFPSFVHLITEKVLTAAYDSGSNYVDGDSYEQGLEDALSSIEFSLKKNYEAILHRNTHKYEHVVWAIANDRLLDVNVDIIWQHYTHICDIIKIKPASRPNIKTKLNQLSTSQYGNLLYKPRRSNYTFSEKMMRAYARLRAERQGCPLGPENPAL